MLDLLESSAAFDVGELAGERLPRHVAPALAVLPALAALHELSGLVELAQFRTGALQELRDAFRGSCARWVSGRADEAAAHWCVAVDARQGSEARQGSDAQAADVEAAGAWFTACELTPRSIVARVREQVPGLTTCLVIERAPGRPPFGSQDLAHLQLMAAQLLVAWRNCQLLALYRRAATAGGQCLALVDRCGNLHAADARFLGALRRCWPGWAGPCLPVPLRQMLADGVPVLAGETQWSATLSGDLRFLGATSLGSLARLSVREREVALALLQGGSYAQCARQLAVSPNTLRNTIARVYRKLGVAGKLELAMRVGFQLPA